jgi:hypothetical protein
MIKEGNRNWKEIENPYLLQDQSRHSMITLKATNFRDTSVTINIENIPYNWKSLIQTSFVVIIIIILLALIIKKRYVNKK